MALWREVFFLFEKDFIPNVIQKLEFGKAFALDFYQAKQLLFYIGAMQPGKKIEMKGKPKTKFWITFGID